MKIADILGTHKIFEVLKPSSRKAQRTIKPIKAKKPDKTTIKPISSQSSLTPEKVRIQAKKDNADSAEQAVKRERTIQKWNKKQREARN